VRKDTSDVSDYAVSFNAVSDLVVVGWCYVCVVMYTDTGAATCTANDAVLRENRR